MTHIMKTAKRVLPAICLVLIVSSCSGASQQAGEPATGVPEPPPPQEPVLEPTGGEAIDTVEELDAWLDSQVKGDISPAVLHSAMKVVLPQLRYCYEKALITDATLRGKVVMKFAVDQDGEVSHAVMVSSEIPSDEFQACILDTVLSSQFPAPEGGVVAVQYPLVFEPEPTD